MSYTTRAARWSAFLMLFGCAAVGAQNLDFDVLVDVDDDAATGCAVTPSGAAPVAGFEQRLRAGVDTSTFEVVTLTQSSCAGTAFGAPAPVAGFSTPYPLALNGGSGGADAIELAVSRALLNATTRNRVRLVFVGDSGSASDLLSTIDGSAPIVLDLPVEPVQVPTLSIAGVLVLAGILLLLAAAAHRRLGRIGSVMAVMLVAGAAWAMNFVLNGDLSDWTAVPPLAQDPTGDATDGSSAIDITAGFAALEGANLYFRIDVVDFENEAPVAIGEAFSTDEDTALSVAAPGVLANDSDAESDPLSAVLITGPTDAQSFILNPDGSFDYTPAADFNGTDGFTYVANDGQSDSAPAAVTITVGPVNDAPVAAAGSASTGEDTPVTIPLTGSDVDGDGLTFAIATGPANGSLGTITPLTPASAEVLYTPNPSFNGPDSFTFTVNDGNVDSPAANVTITVNGVNSAPGFTPGGNVTVNEDAGPIDQAWATAISAGPPDESGQGLSFNITGNDNPGLFSAGPAVDPVTGNLSFTPAADRSGSANLTLVLTDDGGTANGGVDTSTPASFTITVNPANDAPSFTAGTGPAVLEDSGAYDQPWASAISAGPTDESGQVLTFNITANDNPGLFAAGPAIDPGTGNLSFTPLADASGVANLTVELMDDGGTANGGVNTSAGVSLVVTVAGINDAPSFTAGSDPTVDEDSGAQTINGWATGISAGAPDESGQVLTFNITSNTNPGLFSAGPAVDPTSGDLTFTPAANANGSTTISVELLDDGGTANGGLDFSPPQSFLITVNPINDPPQLAAPGPFDVTGNVRIQVTDGPDDLLIGASDPADGAGGTPFTATVATTSSTMGGDVSIGADGSFGYNPPAGYTGTDSFTYEVCDSGVPGSACATAVVTLNVSDMVWFIDPLAAAGDGRLGTPFNDIDAFDAINDGTGTNPAANQAIFLFNGTHDGSVTLLMGQRMFGQSATAPLATLTGITLPMYSDPFPPTNTGSTMVQANNANAITLGANNTLRGFSVGDTGTGSDITGNGFGTLTVSEVTLTGSGRALNLANGTLADGAGSPGFGSITSTSGSNNISLVNVNGSPTMGSGALSGASGVAFLVNGGTGSFSYGGSISNSASRVVDIQNKTGGVVNLSGNITGTSQGIVLTGNTGAAISFSGTLTLTTGANDAFSATGGGSIDATGTGSTINTTTGTGIRITDLTIASAGFAVQSVSVNGAPNGIVLTNTGTVGDFIVTGDGTLARNGSGGTIQNTTDDGVFLTNANNVVLQQMNLLNIGDTANPGDIANTANDHAVESRGGGNITLSAVHIQDPIGTGWEAFDITGDNGIDNNSLVEELDRTSNFNGLRVTNTNTSFGSVSILNSTFDHADPTPLDPANNGNAMVVVSTRGTAGGVFNVNGSTFTGARGTAITVNSGDTAGSSGTLTSNIINSTFEVAHAVNGQNNIGMQAIQATRHNKLADGNTLRDVGRGGSLSGQIIMQKSNTAIMDAEANNNVISAVPAQHGLDALSLSTSTGGRVDWEANGNTIFNVGRRGIFNSARGNEPDMDVALRNNTVGRNTGGAIDPVGFDPLVQRGVEIDVQTGAFLQGTLIGNEVIANTSGSAIGGLASAVMFVNVEEFPSGTAIAHVTFDNNVFTNQDGTGSPNVLARTRDAGLTHALDFNATTANGMSSSVLLEEFAGSTVTLENLATVATDNPGVSTFNIGGGITDHGGNVPEPDF